MDDKWKDIEYPLKVTSGGIFLGDKEVPSYLLSHIMNPTTVWKGQTPRHTTSKEVPNEILAMLENRRFTHRTDYHKVNKKLKELCGPKLVRRLKAKFLDDVINPLGRSKRVINLNGRSWRFRSPRKIEQLFKNYDNIKQTSDDGMHQIVPLLLVSGLDARGFRSIVGKASWRKLLRNSVSRNTHYARLWELFKDDFKDPLFINRLQSLTGVQLELINTTGPREVYAGIIHGSNNPATYGWYKKGSSRRKIKADFDQEMFIVFDVRRMSEQLGVEFNPNWSTRRMHEVHTDLTKALRVQNKSAEPFLEKRDVHTFQVFDCGESYTVTLTRLVSEAEVGDEGLNMRHCVGSYSGSAARDNYSVYHVVCPEKEITATLGLNHTNRNIAFLRETCSFCMDEAEQAPITEKITSFKERSFQQMYSQHNRSVPNDIHNLVRGQLIPQLNKGAFLEPTREFFLDNEKRIMYTSTLEEIEPVRAKEDILAKYKKVK